jgi:ribonuclease Z
MEAMVTILGSNSASPTLQRNPSGQLLQLGGQRILLDCGEGTQKRLLENKINFQKINVICISHLHGDHYFGLMGLLNTMSLNARSKPLHIICPVGLKELNDHIIELGNIYLSFPVTYHQLEAGKEHEIELHGIHIHAIEVSHRVTCFAYKVREAEHPRKLNTDACQRNNVPTEYFKRIKEGEDYISESGDVIPNTDLTFDPADPVTYGYITDTLFLPDLAPKFSDCDTVYHEATYLHNLIDRAAPTFHSTALQAAKFAKIASVNQLLIGHFSSRYDRTEDHLNEAKAVFPNTLIAEEGKSFPIV